MTTPGRLALGAALVLAAGLAWAQTPSNRTTDAPAPPPVSLSALVDQMMARFPRVEGDVVEVNGKTLTLSVGRRQAVEEGLTLTVYREGREIRHPRSGELLGRAEETIGRATVTKVSEAFSTATLDGADGKVNDRVRAGVGKVKVTLVPLRGGVRENLVEAVAYELYDGLLRSGKFDVVLGDQIAVWLTQQGIAPADIVQGRGVAEAAARFRAEHMLVVAFSTVERKPFMDVRFFVPPRSEPALSTAFFVPPSIKPRTPGHFSASEQARVTPERKPRSLLSRLLRGDIEPGTYSSGEESIPLREVARFGFGVVAFDMGTPADRVPRVALSDGDRVFVHKVVGQTLEAEWTYSGRHLGQVISIYLVDVDGDGVPEVAVNRYDPTLGMNSLILGVKDGRPRVLVDNIRAFLVALDETGAGFKQTLWTQDFSPTTLFARRVERATVKNGKLVRLGTVRVPESFRATGVSTSNLMGKDSRALVYIDEYKRLRLMLGNEEFWRGSSPVGGGGFARVELPYRGGGDAGVSKFYDMEPTPLSVDLDGDGVEEVVVPQNQLPGMLAVIFKGPAGVRFQQVASGFEGIITGLGAVRGDDRESPALLACLVRPSGFLNVKTAAESQIIMTVQE
jgi:hypothetical protein